MSENKRNWFTTNIHELVHFTKQNAAKAYERLENHIIDWFLSENNLGGYESAVEAYMRTYSKSNPNFTRADAKEEITADSIAALFSTKDGAKSFVHYIADTYKQKAMEIFDTFEEWINNIITAINTMLKSDVLSPLQRSVLQMDEKQAASIRRQFLSALDEAVNNYRSYKTEQKNNTADGDVKNSKTLGKFADVDVNTKDELYYFFGNDVRLNNVSYTQTKVKNKLISDNFFSKNNRNIVVNADSNIIVEISPDGIDETLSYGKRYYKTPRFIKEAKIATIRSLPELIKYAEVKELNQINYHGKSARFLVLEHPARVDGKLYNVEIKIKKTTKNKFYIHNLTLIKETDTPDAEVADKSTSTAIMSSNQSLTQNVSQNNSNVNNIAKNSLDVDIDGAKYEQAINENDIETAQQLVDKAAVEWGALTNIDGSPLRLYHGTTNYEEKSIWNKETKTFDTDYKKFTVFKNQYDNQTGYFFSSDKDNAGGYGSSIYEVYMKMNKPLTIDCDKSNYSAITYKDQIKDTYGWAEYAQSNGFDGVIFKNISDGAGFSDLQNITDDYVVFNSSQIKSAEAITYDNTGKVIPLNKRFGFYQDIRYSKDVDFSYDTLVNKPDMEITVINDKKIYQATKEGRKNLVNSALRSALSVGFKNESGNTFVHVDDIDTDVLVSKKGLRHSLDRRFNILAPVTENIGDILKNSIKINELTPQFDLIEKSYVLIGVAKNNENEPYIVSFVVNRASNEVTNVNVLYAVNAKTEPAGSLSPELSSQSDVSLTGSKISISILLDYVNNYYPDILPESVLRHYGYTSRPDGKLGNSALYSKDVNFTQSELESLKDENSTLRSENMYLATINEELKTGFKLTGGRVINPRLAKVVAQRIKETWNTTLSSDDIAEMVRQISVRHQNDADFNWNVLLAECKAIAQDVWNNQKAPELDSYAKEILTDIRSSKISLTEEQKKETAYHNDTYRDYLRNNFGNIKIANDGVPLDVKWMEWSEKYPDLFNPETTDLFQHILHLSQNINNR